MASNNAGLILRPPNLPRFYPSEYRDAYVETEDMSIGQPTQPNRENTGALMNQCMDKYGVPFNASNVMEKAQSYVNQLGNMLNVVPPQEKKQLQTMIQSLQPPSPPVPKAPTPTNDQKENNSYRVSLWVFLVLLAIGVILVVVQLFVKK